jgi:hypothetical protein
MSSALDSSARPQGSAVATREAFVELEFHAGRGPRRRGKSSPENVQAVVDFWCEAGPSRWFAKDADFDRRLALPASRRALSGGFARPWH